MNRTFLKNHGLDENGQLYKVTFYEWDKYDAVMMSEDDPEFDRAAFEKYLEIKGNKDNGKLRAATEDVKNYLKPIRDTVEEHFDAENICYWMAFNILICNYDSGARNLFIYSPMNSRKLYFIPWDLDASMRTNYFRWREYHEGESWERGMRMYLGLVLVNRMMKKEYYREMLTDAVNDLYAHYLSPESVQQRADRLAAVTRAYLYGEQSSVDGRNVRIEDQAVFDALISQMGALIEDNYRYYSDTLNDPWPFYVGLPIPDEDNGEHILYWGASYDVNGEAVTYDYILAWDYEFSDVIDHGQNLIVPSVTTKWLEPGKYFLRVRATDESGRTTDCFDYYSTHINGKAYGCCCFIVNEDGTTEPYVEIRK